MEAYLAVAHEYTIDGETAVAEDRLPLHDAYPASALDGKEIEFIENDEYTLSVHGLEAGEIENVEVLIGDLRVRPETEDGCFDKADGCVWKSEKERVFLTYSGLTHVTVCVDVMRDGRTRTLLFYTDFFLVISKKQSQQQVSAMLRELEEEMPECLRTGASQVRMRSGLKKDRRLSNENMLLAADDILHVYRKNLNAFRLHMKTAVETVPVITDIRSAQRMDARSMAWIVRHPESLTKAAPGTGIHIAGSRYVPVRAETAVLKNSDDIYENRVVPGFLYAVCMGIERRIRELDEAQKAVNAASSGMKSPPSVYYLARKKQFDDKLKELRECAVRYEKVFACTPQIPSAVPTLTNTFKHVHCYRECYDCMVRWYTMGDYSLDDYRYLFSLKTISRLFEYDCLIKILHAAERQGFSLKHSACRFHSEKYEQIQDFYVFTKDDADPDADAVELTIFYEPHIYRDRLTPDLNLYCAGCEFPKDDASSLKAVTDRYPDFVLKIKDTRDDREYYCILDAKYSGMNNVERYYMMDLIIKYDTQLASNRSPSRIIGIGALYPAGERHQSIKHYRTNNIDPEKQPLPEYVSIPVVPGPDGDENMDTVLRRIMKVVERV